MQTNDLQAAFRAAKRAPAARWGATVTDYRSGETFPYEPSNHQDYVCLGCGGGLTTATCWVGWLLGAPPPVPRVSAAGRSAIP